MDDVKLSTSDRSDREGFKYRTRAGKFGIIAGGLWTFTGLLADYWSKADSKVSAALYKAHGVLAQDTLYDSTKNIANLSYQEMLSLKKSAMDMVSQNIDLAKSLSPDMNFGPLKAKLASYLQACSDQSSQTICENADRFLKDDISRDLFDAALATDPTVTAAGTLALAGLASFSTYVAYIAYLNSKG